MVGWFRRGVWSLGAGRDRREMAAVGTAATRASPAPASRPKDQERIAERRVRQLIGGGFRHGREEAGFASMGKTGDPADAGPQRKLDPPEEKEPPVPAGMIDPAPTKPQPIPPQAAPWTPAGMSPEEHAEQRTQTSDEGVDLEQRPSASFSAPDNSVTSIREDFLEGERSARMRCDFASFGIALVSSIQTVCRSARFRPPR
jgi:hypothetical protein